MSERRRYKLTARRKGEYLDLLREGQRRGAAAAAIGVSRNAIRNLMIDEPDFAAAVDLAEMDANELVEDALFQAAASGNVTACQVWLYNRDSGRWRDMRAREAVAGMEKAAGMITQLVAGIRAEDGDGESLYGDRTTADPRAETDAGDAV